MGNTLMARLLRGALAGAVLLSAACGSEDRPTEVVAEGEALPLAQVAPQAYTEAHLAQRPNARPHPRHLIVLRADPTGAGPDDSGSAGFDRVSYRVDRETPVSLSIDGSGTSRVQRLVLRDRFGQPIARHERGSPATPAIVLPAGTYLLDVHYEDAGSDTASRQLVFVGPLPAAPATPDDALAIVAAHDCLGCNFTSADLHGQDFSGVRLDGSKFANAKMADAKFVSAQMEGCMFWAIVGDTVSTLLDYKTDLTRTDFTSAKLHFAQFNGILGAGTKFTGADLRASTWIPVQALRFNSVSAFAVRLQEADFSGADLTGSDFRGATVQNSSFRGAVLAGAFLSSPGKDLLFGGPAPTLFDGSDFGPNTASGRSVDLSNATLSGTYFGGLNLAGANLTNATVTGASFDGTILTGATLAGLRPSTFGAPFDHANLSSVSFNGVDLSQADLSEVVLAAAPDFTGAALSDGTRGVDLSGHRFPAGYTGFRGKLLAGVNLSGTSLVAADLGLARLAGAKLVQADLSGAVLDGAVLAGADLSQAVLNRATLRCVTPAGGPARCADLSNATLFGAQLNNANLEGATLYRAFLANNVNGRITNSASVQNAHLKNVNLSYAELSGVNFSFSNFYGDDPTGQAGCKTAAADYAGATAGCASAHGATMTDTVFDDAYLYGVDFTDAAVTGVSFLQAVLTGTNFSGATLTGFSGSGKPTTFRRAFLQGANLAQARLGCTGNVGCYDLTDAFVDFTAGGNIVYILLNGTNHNRFACPAGAACAPPSGQDVCVGVVYPAPTTVLAGTGNLTCPDGTTQACGAATPDGSNRRWASGLAIGSPPPGVPPAWYDQNATYTPRAGAQAVCGGKGADAATLLW